jgi:hypothetical protein
MTGPQRAAIIAVGLLFFSYGPTDVTGEMVGGELVGPDTNQYALGGGNWQPLTDQPQGNWSEISRNFCLSGDRLCPDKAGTPD